MSEETGIHPLDVGLKRPSLDDVFLSLTGHAAEEKTTEEEVVSGRRKKAKK
jgi:ABC-2 type transport system ATP-binding protein